jgi:predicted flap endonuclease-1-like 5' DNA nuclease/ribosomal protein S16
MTYLIGKIIFCLLLASIFGAIIGWLLKRFFAKKHDDEQLTLFEVERTQHQQNITDLNNESEEKQALLDKEKSKMKKLRDISEQESVGLLTPHQTQHQQINVLTEQLAKLKKQSASYQKELSRLIQEKQVLEEAHQCLSKENNEYEEALCEMGCLKEQLIALTHDRDQIQTKISQLSTELSTEQECTAALREKNSRMQTATQSDDLKKINGIGKANEQALKKQGVTCYAQIAAFTAEDEKKYGNKLGVFAARITQEEWVKQAKHLYKEKYGEEI